IDGVERDLGVVVHVLAVLIAKLHPEKVIDMIGELAEYSVLGLQLRSLKSNAGRGDDGAKDVDQALRVFGEVGSRPNLGPQFPFDLFQVLHDALSLKLSGIRERRRVLNPLEELLEGFYRDR